MFRCLILLILFWLTPHLSLANEANLPRIAHGPISGELSHNSIVLWARGNTTGQLIFELSQNSDFSEPEQSKTIAIDANSDFIGEVYFSELEHNTQYYYQVKLRNHNQTSQPINGQFHTAPEPNDNQPVNFVFGACIGGQNYCRDPQTGWKIFDAMRATAPDFFILTGDSIYADTACKPDKNIAGAEGPYTELAGFRTRYRYHLEDPAYQHFLKQTPVYVTWDDHELQNDYGAPALRHLLPQLVADGQRAFFDYWPVMPSNQPNDPYRLYRQFSYGAQADFFMLDTRAYRDPNIDLDPNPKTAQPKTLLGKEQLAWLQKSLSESQATWKFIITSVPLAYPTGFPKPEAIGHDGWANGDHKTGYETELLSLLFFIESHHIQNVIFLAGDTHWPFAISYDPDRDGKANFYEFASSPLSAIVLPPAAPDPTFNPTVLYAEGKLDGTLFNFAQVSIDESGLLSFRVIDRDGKQHYQLSLQAQ